MQMKQASGRFDLLEAVLNTEDSIFFRLENDLIKKTLHSFLMSMSQLFKAVLIVLPVSHSKNCLMCSMQISHIIKILSNFFLQGLGGILDFTLLSKSFFYSS